MNEFDLNKVRDSTLIYIIGTNKYTLIKDILINKKHLPMVVFNLTEEFNDIIPHHANIHKSYSSDKILKLVKDQRLNNNKTLLLIDDCPHTIYKDKSIRDIFMNCGNLKLLTILTSRDLHSIDPILRSNIDYIYIFSGCTMIDLKKIYSYYGNIFNTFEEFHEVYIRETENNRCIVFNLLSISENIIDNVFWYEPKNMLDL